MKDCIQDFVEAWKKYDQQDGYIPNWNLRFREAGYYMVVFDPMYEWTDAHRWCQKQIGARHYAWTGNVFWFETEEAAILFTLRWV